MNRSAKAAAEEQRVSSRSECGDEPTRLSRPPGQRRNQRDPAVSVPGDIGAAIGIDRHIARSIPPHATMERTEYQRTAGRINLRQEGVSIPAKDGLSRAFGGKVVRLRIA